ncbi:hypothetical protein LGK95_13090 [Clostridium algoriphilum]|uniref:hypothetical protein n=1 Tax=Clostridium algoriphilum TaxID=198347 RepID=UPI001CF10B59|nr:hypothetical protein [Clostridium algoriphilum]MCB2294445.1 hypothetical protein [Clostridium algoriphilum]
MSKLNEILEIKKTTADITEVNIKKNSIGITLKLVGWIIMAVGIVAGLAIGALLTVPTSSVLSNPNPLRWVYGIVIMVSSFLSGILFVGFGEIIILLNNINSK